MVVETLFCGPRLGGSCHRYSQRLGVSLWLGSWLDFPGISAGTHQQPAALKLIQLETGSQSPSRPHGRQWPRPSQALDQSCASARGGTDVSSGWRAWPGCLWIWGGGMAWRKFRYGEPESRIRWSCHDTMTIKLRATHLAPPAYAHLKEYAVLSEFRVPCGLLLQSTPVLSPPFLSPPFSSPSFSSPSFYVCVCVEAQQAALCAHGRPR